MALPPPPDWLVAGPRPVLMAIGDSFLNGMRSLTIDDALARLSIPAEVGRALRVPAGFAAFAPAEYPRPVLLQVEALLRDRVTTEAPLIGLAQLVAAVGAIRGGVLENARAWVRDLDAPPPARPRRFDNLAMNGARLPDLFGCRFADVEARWQAMRTRILAADDPFAWKGRLPEADPYGDDRPYADQPGPFPDDPLLAQPEDWGLADIHITLNARHVFNPDNGPGLDAYRVIDVVHARRPHILLLDIGPNHALPDICIAGAGERGAARIARFAALWPRCAAELAATPELGLAVILLPPRPSQVPALMPPHDINDNSAPPPPPGHDYHPAYVSAMTFQPPGRQYSEAEMRGLDAAVEAARVGMRAAAEQAFAAAGKRVAFVDLAELIGRHDAKNGRGVPFVPDPATGIGYDNRCIGRQRKLGAPALRGGIASLDNFHPTTLGYRYVARAIAEAIEAALPGAVARLPEVSIAGDTLLEDPPFPALALLSNFWPFDAGLAAGAAAGGQVMRRLLQIGGMR